MATIDLITYDQKMVTPKDDALIHQFGISNGVLYGCEVTLANSNTLHITGGQGVIYGRQWEIAEGDITVTLPASGSLKGRLYVKIDLSNTTNPIELLVQTAVTLPDLTDDDQINVDNSVSELEICTFDVSSLTISNLERTVEQVADGDHQDVVDLQADVSEIKSNLTDLESEVDDKLKLTVIRSVATWNVGSSYTFTQEDWDKYTEFHVFISHANVANPSYYEVVFNKYFYTVQRIVGYGGTSGNNYVQMSGDATNKRLTLNAAVNASTTYNPLIGIYGR